MINQYIHEKLYIIRETESSAASNLGLHCTYKAEHDAHGHLVFIIDIGIANLFVCPYVCP